jgi:hypothetical protein
MNNDISGLIELNTGDYVNLAVLRNSGLILPIDDYLNDNEVYQSMPAAMKSAFTLPDGKTWALCTQSFLGIYSRNLKTSWLDALGLDVPYTLEQLYEVSRAFAYDDPNGNNKSDEHGMDINIQTAARMLSDIFFANDCFLSNYSACSISYDYSTEAYEDAVLKPGMLDSLLYIKRLNDNGILHINRNWDFMEREGFGNFYDCSSFFPPEEGWEPIYTFNHGEYPTIRALKPDNCFILTSNTENPGQVLNSFVNTFMGSPEGMAMGMFGVPGHSYSTTGSTITQLIPFNDSNTINLTSLNTNILDQYMVDIQSEYLAKDLLEQCIRENRLINEMYSKNLLFTDSWFLPHDDYKNAQSTFGHTMYRFLNDMGNISPDEFIENYKKNAITGGFDKILDDLNEDAGTFAEWSYFD